MRAFLAVEPPAEQRGLLSELLARTRRPNDGWRWITDSALHLTLKFIGEISTELDARARREWREVARRAPRFRLAFCGWGTFPAGPRARVLWIGAREEGTVDHFPTLVSAIEARARELGFPSEPRPPQPHVTVARARRDANARIAPSDLPVLPSFEIREIVLFESRLERTGARYFPIERMELGG